MLKEQRLLKQQRISAQIVRPVYMTIKSAMIQKYDCRLFDLRKAILALERACKKTGIGNRFTGSEQMMDIPHCLHTEICFIAPAFLCAQYSKRGCGQEKTVDE